MDADKQRIAELVLEIQNGNNDAFNELYRLTSSRAYFVALQITKNEEDAQDVLQDSYIKALEKIGSLDKPESFVSWFHQMVANKSKDSLKKKKPSLFEGGEDEAFEVIPDEDETFTPEKNLDQTELQKAIMEAIDELSEEKRACVLMMYFEEMSVNEIAQSLDLSVSTVKNRLFTARKDLKSSFEKRGITSVYSAAPIGAVIWALTRLSDAVSKTFAGSTASSQVLAGVTAAGAGSAAAAGSVAAAGSAAAAGAGSAAAAGTGFIAKAAALTIAQKVVAGVAVAGVVTGSAVGVTTVIKNNRESQTTTTTYIEEVTTAPITEIEVFAVVTETGTTLTLTAESSAQTKAVSSTRKREPTATVAHSSTLSQTQQEKTTVQSTKKTRPTTTRRDYSLDYTKATTLPSTTVAATTAKTTTQKQETTTEKTTEPATKPTTAKPTTTEAPDAKLIIDVKDYDDNTVATISIDVPEGTVMDWDYLVELVRSKGYEAKSGVFGDALGAAAQAGETYEFRAEL